MSARQILEKQDDDIKNKHFIKQNNCNLYFLRKKTIYL